MSLATQFHWSPDSIAIALKLTRDECVECEHGRGVCLVFCGVERDRGLEGQTPGRRPRWRPIPPQRRAEWLRHIYGLTFRDRERFYDTEGRDALKARDAAMVFLPV